MANPSESFAIKVAVRTRYEVCIADRSIDELLKHSPCFDSDGMSYSDSGEAMHAPGIHLICWTVCEQCCYIPGRNSSPAEWDNQVVLALGSNNFQLPVVTKRNRRCLVKVMAFQVNLYGRA